MFRFAFILFCLGLLVSCGGEDVSQNTKRTSNSTEISTERDSFTPLLLPFINDTNLYHKYGENTLRKFDQQLYMFSDNNNSTKIKESYPGILNYINTKNNSWGATILEFREKQKIIKTIDLTTISPYEFFNNHISEIGRLDMEYYSNDTHFDKNYKINADQYHTFNTVNTNITGISIVEFQLIALNKKKIIGWEEILQIYNSKGKFIDSLKILDVVVNPIVSSDFRYLALLVGGSQSSEFQWYSKGEFRIYDLKTKKIIYRQKELENQIFEKLFFVSKDLVALGNNIENGIKKYEYFFDLSKRERLYLEIPKTKYKLYYSNFSNYTNFINSFNLNKKTY